MPLLGLAPKLATASKTFTVNTLNDTDDATPGSGICADSSGNCSLRAAIEEANAEGNANPSMGTIAITVPAGTYTLSLDSAVTSTYALVASDPAGLIITGAGAGSTVVQGKSGATDRVFDVQQGSNTDGANIVLNGLTVQDGVAPGSGSEADGGGGIAVIDSNDLLQLNDVTVAGNSAGFGGGIDNEGSLWVTSSEINANKANDTDGEPEGAGMFDGGVGQLDQRHRQRQLGHLHRGQRGGRRRHLRR
jgi:CSLREA domain-containing protein